MAYEYVRSIALSRSIGSQWEPIDLSQRLMYDIFNTYTKTYLVLKHQAIVGDIYVDLDVLKPEFSSYDKTLNELLVELGPRSLPTVSALPNTQAKTAKYTDAIRAMYKINLTKIGVVDTASRPKSELPDLKITRPRYQTDMQLLHDYCLISVNGLYHLDDTDGTSAFVYEGGLTAQQSRTNHVGILSFLNMGTKLQKSKLKPEQLSPEPNGTMKDKVYISTGIDLTDKSFFLVLGGYLVFPAPGTMWQVSDMDIVLDLNRIPYIERLMESRLYLDMTSLGLPISDLHSDLVNVSEVWSDDTITKYLTMSQSFLVVLDIPHLVTNKIYLRHSSLPGMLTSYQDPVYPLVVGHGKTAEYWKVFEDGHWAVHVADSFYRNYVFTHQPTDRLKNITNNLTPVSPFFNSKGFLLEITGYRT